MLLYERRKRKRSSVPPPPSSPSSAPAPEPEETYHFVGYTTLFPFYCFPEKTRIRISQFVILPPYQQEGHGCTCSPACRVIAAALFHSCCLRSTPRLTRLFSHSRSLQRDLRARPREPKHRRADRRGPRRGVRGLAGPQRPEDVACASGVHE